MKKQRLTVENQKMIKYSLRPAYIYGIIIFLISIVFSSIPVMREVDENSIYIFLAGLSISVLIVWLINRKYWTDLRNDEKQIITKVVGRKEKYLDYEAGSSVGYSMSGENSSFYKEMNSRDVYSFIIDNVRHKVDKEIWMKVKEKGEIEMHYSISSNDLLEIKGVETSENN